MKVSLRNFGWLFAAILLFLSACQPAPTAAPATAPASTANTAAPAGTAPAPLNTPNLTAVPGANPPGPAAPSATPIVVKLEGASTTDTGLQYLEVTPGKGAQPKKGELVTLNFSASLPDGTVLQDTFAQGQPVVTVWDGGRLLPGWQEAVGMMKVGTRAKIVLPPSLAYGSQGSQSIPPNTPLVMEVELVKSEPAPQPTEVAADKLTKTATGLQYYDIKKGTGDEAVKNASVSTKFTIWVKTDAGYTFVDSSDYTTPVDFVIGRLDAVFPGWDEGTTGMKVGGKRLLVIPADLGMGSMATSIIPANSTLVMEVELTKATTPRTAAKVDEKDYTTTASGLKYYDLKPGTGATPKAGQTVVVHYTGWLEDGTQFDSSVDRGEPFNFVLGAGNVIAGWDEGVASMKVGGKRQLVIPASLGYGDSGAGGVIPPGATLIFEVELLDVQQP